MNNSRGRPVGFKLSEESKGKIRNSRLDTSHSLQTKRKISCSLKKYFQTPMGKAVKKKQSELWSVMMTDKWHKFLSSEESEPYINEFSDVCSRMCTAMHKFNKEN